jgi:hypothetical protein
MKLLEAEPALAPPPPQAPPPEAPALAAAPPEAPPRACAGCGAPLEPEQDWCLACGTAVPGRLGERPGWRAALAVALLATVLVAVAVAAAYAAMTDDAAREASAPATADIAPQQTPAPATPAAEQPPIQATTEDDLPQVDSGAGPVTDAPAAEPLPDTSSSLAPPIDDATTTEDDGAADDTPAITDPGPSRIEVDEDAGAIYDPLERARNAGTESRALDGDPQTNWAFSSKVPAQPGVGYRVTLEEAQGIKELRLRTSTPGFKVEVYATDEATPPPEITDTRWAHIEDRSKVKERQRIVLGGGTSEYRTLLLWFTEPPAEGARIRLDELRLYG